VGFRDRMKAKAANAKLKAANAAFHYAPERSGRYAAAKAQLVAENLATKLAETRERADDPKRWSKDQLDEVVVRAEQNGSLGALFDSQQIRDAAGGTDARALGRYIAAHGPRGELGDAWVRREYTPDELQGMRSALINDVLTPLVPHAQRAMEEISPEELASVDTDQIIDKAVYCVVSADPKYSALPAEELRASAEKLADAGAKMVGVKLDEKLDEAREKLDVGLTVAKAVLADFTELAEPAADAMIEMIRLAQIAPGDVIDSARDIHVALDKLPPSVRDEDAILKAVFEFAPLRAAVCAAVETAIDENGRANDVEDILASSDQVLTTLAQEQELETNPAVVLANKHWVTEAMDSVKESGGINGLLKKNKD
jgi:hypothetical protein